MKHSILAIFLALNLGVFGASTTVLADEPIQGIAEGITAIYNQQTEDATREAMDQAAMDGAADVGANLVVVGGATAISDANTSSDAELTEAEAEAQAEQEQLVQEALYLLEDTLTYLLFGAPEAQELPPYNFNPMDMIND